MTQEHKSRCWWPGEDSLYLHYHDTEWGVPVYDDVKHFEFLCLEGQQAGLSWITVLRKRENYRRSFKGFDPVRVARMRDATLEKMLQDTGLIRNRAKIFGVRTNARAFLEVQKEFGSFTNYIWSFVGGKPIDGKRKSRDGVPSTSVESDALSADLKKRGFKFVGSTICYAHLQAAGLINDHVSTCFRYQEVKRLAKPVGPKQNRST
ncbi:MAG: DNA-3-methyladenine glycosylase I [Pseudohongiellaceae bacterium]